MRTIPPPPSSLIRTWLKRRLSDGPVSADDLYREAKELDVSPARLRRAAKSMGVAVWKEGYQGKWWWGILEGGPTRLEQELKKEVTSREVPKVAFPERPSMFDGMRLSEKAT